MPVYRSVSTAEPHHLTDLRVMRLVSRLRNTRTLLKLLRPQTGSVRTQGCANHVHLLTSRTCANCPSYSFESRDWIPLTRERAVRHCFDFSTSADRLGCNCTKAHVPKPQLLAAKNAVPSTELHPSRSQAPAAAGQCRQQRQQQSRKQQWHLLCGQQQSHPQLHRCLLNHPFHRKMNSTSTFGRVTMRHH